MQTFHQIFYKACVAAAVSAFLNIQRYSHSLVGAKIRVLDDVGFFDTADFSEFAHYLYRTVNLGRESRQVERRRDAVFEKNRRSLMVAHVVVATVHATSVGRSFQLCVYLLNTVLRKHHRFDFASAVDAHSRIGASVFQRTIHATGTHCFGAKILAREMAQRTKGTDFQRSGIAQKIQQNVHVVATFGDYDGSAFFAVSPTATHITVRKMVVTDVFVVCDTHYFSQLSAVHYLFEGVEKLSVADYYSLPNKVAYFDRVDSNGAYSRIKNGFGRKNLLVSLVKATGIKNVLNLI